METNIGIYKINLPLLNNDWDNHLSTYYNDYKEKIKCFEKRVLVKTENSCNSSTKTNYISSNDSVVNINGKSISLGVGFRKKNIYWKTKSTLQFLIENEITDYKVNYDDIFNNLNNYEQFFPRDQLYSSIITSFSYKNSINLRGNYSLGLDISTNLKKYLNKNVITINGILLLDLVYQINF